MGTAGRRVTPRWPGAFGDVTRPPPGTVRGQIRSFYSLDWPRRTANQTGFRKERRPTITLPIRDHDMDARSWFTLALFALTYLALAAGKVPLLRIDRAGIALVGAAAMLGTRTVSLDDAL